MILERILHSQGFGTRRQCRALIENGRVAIDGAIVTDADADYPPQGLAFTIDAIEWTWREHAYLLMHKPAGFECSRNPHHHPSVFTLLPQPLVERNVQCVGRLDQDTTGLLLLSDDGAFIHQNTSPKRKVPKRYRVGTARPIEDAQLEALERGVLLHDEKAPLAALSAVRESAHTLVLTIHEGKYHQVKRMVAATGNHVETLHRDALGALVLPASLDPGQWRWLEPHEFDALKPGAAAR
ncbi:pseudouridine synthase [Pararobbsia silviterrae]|uniref:Pseudouridine synthase n=1 Tax=Pararobbsia silviterrae TaxID=1792498 RepID=A0A494Y341_9BURK|nr:16S rRNA pseudouridine(516) synthase [Pararobbsia silviterrae]RKP56719.1 16S rRNA pseudouridine(516) synthase [Pararobbsia silviterrae]